MQNHRAVIARVNSPEAIPQDVTSPSKAAAQRTKHRQQRLSQWLLLLLGAAGVAFLTSSRLLRAGVRLEQPIKSHFEVTLVNRTQHVASERMLRMMVEECSKGEDSIMWVDPEGSMVVQSEVDPQQCPIMDIMLKGSERSIGMCTDAMLYVLHLGARVIGGLHDARQYDSYCGAATARLFLENMHEEFLSKQPGVLHMQLVNAEHLYLKDAKLHKKMDAFLCKTEVCQELLQQHVSRKGFKGAVWLMGHTSSDPTVDLPPGTKRKNKFAFFHLKGRSGLKHTNQLLECWRSRPDLPTLTVVGRFSWNEVKESIKAPNIVFYPKVTEAYNESQTEHISFSQVRTFQVEQPIHICASEREGFGHYLNEARAAGAFVVSTDHPPMNELITPAIGYLVQPSSTSSDEFMALGRYTHINAFLNASQLCAAADQVLHISLEDITKRGQVAQQAYLHSNAVFLARLQDLRVYLQHHAEAMHISAPRASLWRQQLRRQPWQHRHHRRLSSQHSYEPGKYSS